MWPKLLQQLFELLPHITRIVPMAEKFLSSKAASHKANEAAFAAMTERLRGDLSQVTQAHSGLHLQLQDQAAKLDAVAEQTRLTQLAMEQREHRVESLVQQVTSLTTWVRLTTAIIVLLLVTLLIVILRAHR